MPEEHGGAGLGISEAALMMHTISATGAGLSGASAVHMNIFGLHRWWSSAPRSRKTLATAADRGQGQGLLWRDRAQRRPEHAEAADTRRARCAGNHYVVHGQKVFISTAQVANKILLLTHHAGGAGAGTEGLTLFYTDLDRSKIEVHEIAKLGRGCVDTNQLFIDGLRIPVEDRVGEEGKGFSYILHGMNPERILIAAEAVGLGRALARAGHTPPSARSSAAPSARTRPYSTRWPRPGWTWRPRT